jgi:putative FmdB family regulatory protein
MPFYEYRCDNGHTFEVMQKMSDDPVRECQVCGASVQRVFHPVAVHFKGSGFYNTDYGKKRRGAAEESSGGDTAKSDSDSKSDSSPSKKKSETSTSSSTSSSSSSD